MNSLEKIDWELDFIRRCPPPHSHRFKIMEIMSQTRRGENGIALECADMSAL
jgi:hypothetical protein